MNSQKYKELIKAGSSRFGGEASFGLSDSEFPGSLSFIGLFLGSQEEYKGVLNEYGLLDEDILLNDFSGAVEFTSFVDAQAFKICRTLTASNFWFGWTAGSFSEMNICDDLGLPEDSWDRICPKRDINGFEVRVPSEVACANDADLLNAIYNAGLKPQSFFNRPLELPNPAQSQLTFQGALLGPRMDVETLYEIAKVGVQVNHLNHGECYFFVHVNYNARDDKVLYVLNNSFSCSILHRRTDIDSP